MDREKRNSPLQHFDERSEAWDDLYKRPQFQDRLNLFVNSVKAHVPAGGRILDYGCGTGVIALKLAELGYQVTAIDGALRMVKQGQDAATSTDLLGISFSHIPDPEHWTPEGTYDGVVCSSVLEYVPDDQRLLQQFGKATRDGGWLFVSIPSASSLVGKLENLVGRFKRNNRDVEYAQRRYNISDFGTSLLAVGLSTRECHYFEFPRMGRFGIGISRHSSIGVMALVIAQNTT